MCDKNSSLAAVSVSGHISRVVQAVDEYVENGDKPEIMQEMSKSLDTLLELLRSLDTLPTEITGETNE